MPKDDRYDVDNDDPGDRQGLCQQVQEERGWGQGDGKPTGDQGAAENAVDRWDRDHDYDGHNK